MRQRNRTEGERFLYLCEGNRKWRVLWLLSAEGHVGKYGQGDVVYRQGEMEKEKVGGSGRETASKGDTK